MRPKALADEIVARFMGTTRPGYAHLANVGVVPTEPFSIDGSTVIRRASNTEVGELRQALEFYVPRRAQWNPYETQIGDAVETQPGSHEYPMMPLPENDWRYAVLEYTGSSIREVLLASHATPFALELGFNVSAGGPGVGVSCHRGLEHLVEGWWTRETQLLTLTLRDLERLKSCYARLAAHSVEALPIREYLQRLMDLRELPTNSQMRFLGTFAVLESVITSESENSISRQMHTKMALLNARFAESLPYQMIPGTEPKAIWNKLHKLRSRIAHDGAAPAFKDELRPLKSLHHATSFLVIATAAALGHALIEPELVRDLREC